MKRQILLVVSLAAVFSVSSLFFVSDPSSAQAQTVCSKSTLNGAYGEGFSVFLSAGVPRAPGMSGYIPAAGIARFVFDGNGNLSGKTTVNLNGQFVTDFTVSGNYTVDSDCTGTMTGLFNGNSLNLRFVIVDNGKRLIHIGTDMGSVAFGEFVRQ